MSSLPLIEVAVRIPSLSYTQSPHPRNFGKMGNGVQRILQTPHHLQEPSSSRNRGIPFSIVYSCAPHLLRVRATEYSLCSRSSFQAYCSFIIPPSPRRQAADIEKTTGAFNSYDETGRPNPPGSNAGNALNVRFHPPPNREAGQKRAAR